MLVEANVTGQGTRTRLVLAAVHLFQMRGFHGVGTAEILALASAPRGSLYHHFPDGKEQLACAAVHWLAGEVVSRIQQLRLDGLSPEDVLTTISVATANWMKKTNFSQGPLLAALTTGLGPDDTPLRDALSRAYALITAEHRRMFVASGLADDRAEALATEALVIADGSILLARARHEAAIVTESMAGFVADIRGNGT